MAARLREHGLAIIIDLVPNHMAIPVPEISTPRSGTSCATARTRRTRSGSTSSGPRTARAAGARRARRPDEPTDGDVVRYHEHVFPRGGRYRLGYWREAVPNYRRFFDISTLIGLRAEDPEVFDRTHALPLRLLRKGLVDGLRIDHPDGLADPRGYLRSARPARHVDRGGEDPRRGRGAARGLALRRDHRLRRPRHGRRPVHRPGRRDGADRDLHRPDRRHRRLHRGRARGAGGTPPSGCWCPRSTGSPGCSRGSCPSEDAAELRQVLVELLVAMPVYRTYVVPGEEPSARDLEIVAQTAARGARRPAARRAARPRGAAAPRADRPRSRCGTSSAVRFQQTSAPMMAKGVEDTAFYRWSRLSSLNEVGGDPARFSVPPAEFHEYCAEVARDRPATMTTLSTHDTKRQEDVRARLAVLSELPGDWAEAVGALARPRAGQPAGARPGLPDVADARGRVAAVRRPAQGVPHQGDARGQDPYLLVRTGRGVRGGGARPRGRGVRGRGAGPRTSRPSPGGSRRTRGSTP